MAYTSYYYGELNHSLLSKYLRENMMLTNTNYVSLLLLLLLFTCIHIFYTHSACQPRIVVNVKDSGAACGAVFVYLYRLYVRACVKK